MNENEEIKNQDREYDLPDDYIPQIRRRVPPPNHAAGVAQAVAGTQKREAVITEPSRLDKLLGEINKKKNALIGAFEKMRAGNKRSSAPFGTREVRRPISADRIRSPQENEKGIPPVSRPATPSQTGQTAKAVPYQNKIGSEPSAQRPIAKGNAGTVAAYANMPKNPVAPARVPSQTIQSPLPIRPSVTAAAPVAPDLSAYERAEELHSHIAEDDLASQKKNRGDIPVSSKIEEKRIKSYGIPEKQREVRSIFAKETSSRIAQSRGQKEEKSSLSAGKVSVRRAAQEQNGKTRPIDRKKIRQKTGQSPDNERDFGPSSSGNTVFNLIKAMLYIVIVIAVSGLLSYYIIVFGNDMYAFVKSDIEVEVTIPEYATVEEIAEILGENGVVKYPNLLVLYAKLKKIDKTYEFVAGDYTVNGMMNYDELFYAFVKSTSYETVRITIPEGYTVDEIITLFTENGIGTREKFIDVINNYDFDFEFVKALEGNISDGRTYRLEGYLYPDTYDFYKSSSEVTVIYKLLNRFNTIFSEDFYVKAEELGYSVDEIMILASMIEKEARYAGDYETVSSVFHNRLNNPSNFPRLESDATIMYAIQIRDGERKSKLTSEDLKYDTPYNSYMYNGLTPGPIANPGYEAITCALYPAKTKYYYFVSDNYGNTYFSQTLAQHNAAKEKVKEING